MKIPLHVDSYTLAMKIPHGDETEFLTELFTIFSHHHVIEAYKDIQQRNPDLFPPLLEKQ